MPGLSRFLRTVFLLQLLLSTAPALAEDCLWPDRITQASILPVATDNGSYASGVVVAPNRVLTAAHAIKDAAQAFVLIDKAFRQAELLSMDTEKDLAIMRVDTDNLNPIRLSQREPYENEPVWAIGFPHARFKSTSAGIFQNKLDGVLHTSASIDAGESGGGLLACDRGQFVLAGMLRGYGAYLDGDRYIKIDNHSVSVTARDIERFITW